MRNETAKELFSYYFDVYSRYCGYLFLPPEVALELDAAESLMRFWYSIAYPLKTSREDQ